MGTFAQLGALRYHPDCISPPNYCLFQELLEVNEGRCHDLPLMSLGGGYRLLQIAHCPWFYEVDCSRLIACLYLLTYDKMSE